ncbi:glycerol kinase [Syncephalis fuscata]|nr:glycerol kinase [Syncephalis fuscata]
MVSLTVASMSLSFKRIWHHIPVHSSQSFTPALISFSHRLLSRNSRRYHHCSTYLTSPRLAFVISRHSFQTLARSPFTMTKSSGYVGSIDQGTTSSRFFIFDHAGNVVVSHQVPIQQYHPQAGWHEHDPKEIISSVETCMNEVAVKLEAMGISPSEVQAIGVTNQRETTVCWDATTGDAFYNAIVWCDARTNSIVHQLADAHPTKSRDCIKEQCGLPLTTYFSALKIKWMLNEVKEVQEAAKNDTLRCCTVDSWLIYHLTGGKQGNGSFVTDVTNASRTMLMNIRTLKWCDELCKFFGLSQSSLPEIRSSSEIYGKVSHGPFAGIPLAGCLGDQQAAIVGQNALIKAKLRARKYGTGCFMLFNTGYEPVLSNHGLLTTVAYQLGANTTPSYALEGSISVSGAAVSWLQKNMGIISDVKDIDDVAGAVPDNGGVYFVPSFNGLFAPYWRDDARGCIVGLTHYANKHHIARATLEATCFQSRAILDAMNNDSGVKLTKLRVDGGLTKSHLCMQIQADMLNIPVERPSMHETTSLGAAMAAGLAVGFWRDTEELCQIGQNEITVFEPKLDDQEREKRYALWNRAVQRSLDWVQPEV